MELRTNEEMLQMVGEKNHLYCRNNPSRQRLVGPHTEGELASKNYINGGKNGRQKGKTKTENDVI